MASAQRENELPDFNEHMRNLGQALGYPEPLIDQLIRSFQVFNRQDKYKLIVDTRQYVDSLIQVDRQLANLPNGILLPYMDEIGDNWKEMNNQLTQLQILSLIQKKEDCQEVIKELLRILNDKIRTVNEVLKANLGQPSSQQSQEVPQGSVGSPASRLQDVAPRAPSASASRLQDVASRAPSASRLQDAVSRASRLQAASNSSDLMSQAPFKPSGHGPSVFSGLPPRKGGGSNNDVYMNKYLKYKNKYLSLKKNSI